MSRTPLSLLAFCAFFTGIILPRAQADPVADLAKYSVFSSVDPSSLSGGKILSSRGPALSFPRDLTVQAVYLVHAPVAQAVALHKQWDAARHSELKVYLHHDMAGQPGPQDFTLPIPGNSAARKLAGETGKLPAMGELQLSKPEAAMFKGAGGSGPFPPGVQSFWSQVLLHRASAFAQRGLSGLPPYDSDDGSARVSDEVNRLLRDQPKVSAAFRPLIEKSPLGGGVGSLPLGNYWEMFDVEGEAAFSLGAACSIQTGDSAQLLDLQYYATGGYYAYITLYQMSPVTVDGKPATLVWRVDSISTLSIADLGPFDRMGSGAAMSKEILRIINLFQKDMER